MCGRYAFTGWDETMVQAYDLEESKIRPRYNIAPSRSGTVILYDPDLQKNVVQELIWGLVPMWAKDKAMGSRLVNARSETVDVKTSFKGAFRHRRCLVPVTGFYEWKREGKIRMPYYFFPKKHGPLVLAGLWGDWNDGTEFVRSFTILTTEANELMKPIHDRMPVVLQQPDWNRWLDPQIDQYDDLKALLRPCPNDILQCYEVSDFVNNVGNEGSGCNVKVVKPPEFFS